MPEYIEREAAMDIFGDVPMWDGYYEPYPFEVHCAIVGVVKLIKEELGKVPTADVAPVRHGEWEIVVGSNGKEYMVCTCCRVSQDLTGVFTYCPNCGAKMDGGAD